MKNFFGRVGRFIGENVSKIHKGAHKAVSGIVKGIDMVKSIGHNVNKSLDNMGVFGHLTKRAISEAKKLAELELERRGVPVKEAKEALSMGEALARTTEKALEGDKGSQRAVYNQVRNIAQYVRQR